MKIPTFADAGSLFTAKVVVPAVIVVAAGGYAAFGSGESIGDTLAVARRDVTEQVAVSGTVKAAESADLGFAESGRIAATYARVGDTVMRGALLAEIEHADLSATLLRKQAALDSLIAGTRPEEISVTRAKVSGDEAALLRANQALVNAIRNAYTVSDDAVHNKLDPIFDNARTDPKVNFSVPDFALKTDLEAKRKAAESMFLEWQKEAADVSTAGDLALAASHAMGHLDTVSGLLLQANAALNSGLSINASLSTSITSVGTARANVQTADASLTTALTTRDAEASQLATDTKTLALQESGATATDIAAARADVQNAEAAITRARIVAPFGGTITRMDAKAGEIVSPSTSKISIQSRGVFAIDAYIPQISVKGVVAGNPATVTLDAYGPSVTFAAKVTAVDPAETIREGVPSYKTTLVFLEPDARIRSGMTANVLIATGMLPEAIVIPQGAIGTRDGAQYVSVVENGNVTSRVVTTGRAPMLGQVEVVSGLVGGEVILLTPRP